MVKKELNIKNPALDLINKSIAKVDTAPAGKAEQDTDIETKSIRFQALLYPSVHNRMSQYAKAHRLSNNEIVNRALKAYLDQEE